MTTEVAWLHCDLQVGTRHPIPPRHAPRTYSAAEIHALRALERLEARRQIIENGYRRPLVLRDRRGRLLPLGPGELKLF